MVSGWARPAATVATGMCPEMRQPTCPTRPCRRSPFRWRRPRSPSATDPALVPKVGLGCKFQRKGLYGQRLSHKGGALVVIVADVTQEARPGQIVLARTVVQHRQH